MKKGFYIFPPILTGINFSILFIIGIVSVRKVMTPWDYISVAVGGLLVIVFVAFLISTHKIGQMRMQPEDVDKLVTEGPYQIIRHPNFTGLICMNIAYLLFFRTPWLVPFICAFILLWYLEARYEERILIAKFRDKYRKYIKNTGMFFPKLLRHKSPTV